MKNFGTRTARSVLGGLSDEPWRKRMLLVPLFSAKFVAVFLAFITWMLDFTVSAIALSYVIFGLVTFALASLAWRGEMRRGEHQKEVGRQIGALEEQRIRSAIEATRQGASRN